MAEAIISLRKPIMSSLCYYSNRCKINIILDTTLESIQRQLSKVTWGFGINHTLKEKGKACSLCHNIRSSLEMTSPYCDRKLQIYSTVSMQFWNLFPVLWKYIEIYVATLLVLNITYSAT